MLQALALLGEDFVLAAGLGFQLGVNRGRLTVGLQANLLRLGLGIDDDAGLLGFRGGFELSSLLGLDLSASARAALAIARFWSGNAASASRASPRL